MKVLLLHMPTPAEADRQVALNSDEILRMEEVPGGGTQIIQSDKGPTTVKENLPDILKALDEEIAEVPEEKPEKPEPKAAAAHSAPKAGGR